MLDQSFWQYLAITNIGRGGFPRLVFLNTSKRNQELFLGTVRKLVDALLSKISSLAGWFGGGGGGGGGGGVEGI